MAKYSQKQDKEVDPLVYLAGQVFRQAFREIKAYYYHRGRDEEIRSGFKAIKWIQKMQGNFRVYAYPSADRLDWTLEYFHQKCIEKINKIKRDAYENKYVHEQFEEDDLDEATLLRP